MDAKTPKQPKQAPGWLIESLEISEAQVAAGQTVPLEPFLERVRESIARMEAAKAKRRFL